jgi:mRNA interferase MazF
VIAKRGEVWRVNLDPTIGAEIRKTRPVIVVSSDAVGILPIKLIAPVTDWKDRYANSSWHVRIDPDVVNGLTKPSAVDALQLRGLDTSRFIQKLGRISADKMDEIAAVIAAVVEYV